MDQTQNRLFLDLSLPHGIGQARIATLGPAGTSSETAARKLTRHVSETSPQVSACTQLHDSYEQAGASLRSGSADLLVVANAYAGVSQFYMDPSLRLVGAFVHETPRYGIAVADTEAVPTELRVATHPAPTPLISQLCPRDLLVREVVPVTSTSQAALAARARDVDAALTTAPAAELYGLTFISETRTIEMLWSVFCTAEWLAGQQVTAVVADAVAVVG